MKVEDLNQADWFVIERLNATTKLEHLGKSKYPKRYVEYYRNVSQEHISLIRDIYKIDIDLFEYPESPFEWRIWWFDFLR